MSSCPVCERERQLGGEGRPSQAAVPARSDVTTMPTSITYLTLEPDESSLPDEAPPAGPLRPGMLWGKYRVGEELGRGGMAVVYRAHDVILHRDVALKVRQAAWASAAGGRRLGREALNMARARHPNVVAIYDHFELDGCSAIAMELVDGQPLDEYLRSRGRVSVRDCVRLLGAVLDALTHLHGRGIVHRDIKPANVMVSAPPFLIIKLMDLGLARTKDDRPVTLPGEAALTMGYAAPEIVTGKKVDHRADLYAVGVTAFELLTGCTPFRGDLVAVAFAHLEARPPAPSERVAGIPREVDAVVLKALAKDPAERFASAAEMKAALEAAVSGPTRPTAVRHSRWPARLAVAALVGATTAATAAALAYEWPRQLVVTDHVVEPPRPGPTQPPLPPTPSYRDVVVTSNPFERIAATGSVVIQRRLTSMDEYRRVMAAVGDATWQPFGTWAPDRGDAPATWVAFAQARRYCEALGARLPQSSEWAAAVAPGRIVVGPLAEWTGTVQGGLALVREPTDRGLEPADPYYKVASVTVAPGADADVVAAEKVGFRCAR